MSLFKRISSYFRKDTRKNEPTGVETDPDSRSSSVCFWRLQHQVQQILEEGKYQSKIKDLFGEESGRAFKARIWRGIKEWKSEEISRNLCFDIDRPVLWKHHIPEMEIRLAFETHWDGMIERGILIPESDGKFFCPTAISEMEREFFDEPGPEYV